MSEDTRIDKWLEKVENAGTVEFSKRDRDASELYMYTPTPKIPKHRSPYEHGFAAGADWARNEHTDFEKMRLFLDNTGVTYTTKEDSEGSSITLNAGENMVAGITGFYACFDFTPDGALIQVQLGEIQ